MFSVPNVDLDVDLEDLVRELTEIGVGATILGLRRVNIERRELVERLPQAEPLVDAALDQIEALAGPVSAIVGCVVSSIAEAVPGPAGERLREAGTTLAEAGPELLRLSGLTKRD